MAGPQDALQQPLTRAEGWWEPSQAARGAQLSWDISCPRAAHYPWQQEQNHCRDLLSIPSSKEKQRKRKCSPASPGMQLSEHACLSQEITCGTLNVPLQG